MDSTSSSTTSRSQRWQFLRDVMVFQLKLLLDNLRDFALVPISLVAALIDLIYKGEREGALFYKVLRWGAHSEEVINVYSAIEHHPPGDFKVNPAYTVDAAIARLEGVVVREYEKGGTAASIKAAMDRAIDQLHRETKEKGDRARDVVARAADKLRLKIDQLPPEEEERSEIGDLISTEFALRLCEHMTTGERDILVRLDQILRSEKVRALIRPVVERVHAKLSRETGAVMAWEPIPLPIYGGTLPGAIKSSWVFVLRAGANTGAERHPNSHQRMMSFQGSGDMQVRPESSKTRDHRTAAYARSSGVPKEVGDEWQSNILTSDSDAPLEKRWISIPHNVWHQPVICKETDWAVISFHTVPAEELIEERPESSGEELTKQMRYLG